MKTEFSEDYFPKGISIDVSKPTIRELHGISNWLYINEYIKLGYFTYEQLSDEQRAVCSKERFNQIKNGL